MAASGRPCRKTSHQRVVAMWNWRRFRSRLTNFFRYKRAEQELTREVESHVTLIEDEFLGRGMTPDEARRAARRAFGGIEQANDFWISPSPANFLDWRDQMHSFDGMAAWRNWYYTLAAPGGQGAPESLRGVRVSPSFFDVVGVKPMLGRVLRRNEEEPGHGRVVMLSYSLWQRRFGSNPGGVGKKVIVDGQPFEIVGVFAGDFQFFQSDFDLWMPLTVDNDFHNRTNHSTMVFGRLAPGISIGQAQAEMNSIAHRMEAEYPATNL